MNGKWPHGLQRSGNNGMTPLWFLWRFISSQNFFSVYVFQLWSWNLKNEDPFARWFFKQTEKIYWLLCMQFQSFFILIKESCLIPSTETSWYFGRLYHCIDNYQLSKYLHHPRTERDGSRKKNGHIYYRNMSGEDDLKSCYSGKRVRYLLLWTSLQYDFELFLSALVLILTFPRKSCKDTLTKKNLQKTSETSLFRGCREATTSQFTTVIIIKVCISEEVLCNRKYTLFFLMSSSVCDEPISLFSSTSCHILSDRLWSRKVKTVFWE